MAGVNLINLN